MEKSFRQRVAEFWKAFAEKESEIRDMMDNKVAGETLLKHVDEIVKIAFDKTYFEMGIDQENKYELILTPEGDRVKLMQLKYWQGVAPEELKQKWNFHSFKPAIFSSSFVLSMYDITLALNDVTFYTKIDEEEHKVDIKVYSPNLMTLDEEKRYSMLFIFLDQFIGELYTMEYIGYIDMSEEKPEGDAKNAVELKTFIEQCIAEKEWVKPEDIGHTYSSYKMNPSKDDKWLLRQDIIIGITTSFDVLNSFYSKTDDLIKKYEADGMTFGFVFYENINIPQKEIVGIRGEIEDKILEKAETEHIASSLGGATGNHFSYMDFAIYDLEAFIEIAKEVLSGYDFKETGFSKFVMGAEPTFFN